MKKHDFKPGEKVRLQNGEEGRVMAPSPLGYRFVEERADGGLVECVEVKLPVGGAIMAPENLTRVEG